MSIPRTILLSLSAVATLTLPSSASAQIGSIVGVIERPDGLPESHVIVRIPGTMIGETVDELGRFELHGVPVGVYTLQILQWGRVADSISAVRVSAGDTVMVRHTLPQRKREVEESVPYEPSPSTPLGFWGGLGLTATPLDPVLSVQAGIRYGFLGLQGSYFNVLSAEYPIGNGTVEATPGVDLYLYYSLQKSMAFYLCGGLSFADDNLYGFGVGYTLPFNFDTYTGPMASFGFHTLRGVEISFGIVNL